MTETQADPTFADVFPRGDEARWKALAEAALKGKPFESLISRTAEERPRPWRAAAGPWRVCARVDHPDAAQANALLLADLESGADAIHIVFAGSVGAHGFGLPAGREALEAALAGVAFEARVPIELDLSAATKDSVAFLADMIEARHIDPASYPVTFGFDPFGQMALAGGSPMPWEQFGPMAASLMMSVAARGWRGRFAVSDGRVVNAAGGTSGQELAFVLASALAYLRALEAAGVSLEDARAMIGFRMSVDADEFSGVAKFRALRRLWARVEDACGTTPAPIHVHAETSWSMMTRRDPWVNLLRGTIATFSAGLGGADAITALPFTQALGLPDAFARRLARNTQLILIEESNLGRVADPAAGAGGFEALTDGLCEKAWALFQEIEAAGGLFAMLQSGAFQGKIAAARAMREKDVARRKAAITGVSEFPNIAEAPVAVLAPIPLQATAPAMPIAFDALPPGRDAEPFERLRDRADASASSSGSRPKVFLANLGPLAAFAARSMFARNLFEAGGIEAVGALGFDDDATLIAAFVASGANIACLCSSDALYADRAVAAARALATAGARQVWVAGRPGAAEADWRAAGISGFIFAGCDVLAALEEAQRAT
jgi:methylmalonyl-CoA mutase